MSAHAAHKELLQRIYELDFPRERYILTIFRGGSDQHGVKLPGVGDIDICGVYLESPYEKFGLAPHKSETPEHFVSTVPLELRKYDGTDVDVHMFSLGKWAKLAANGSPHALSYLFSPGAVEYAQHQAATALYSPPTPWLQIAASANLFRTRRATPFLSTGDQHVAAALGEKRGTREKLATAHGYDTKAAFHALRFYMEGREWVSSGTLTYPCPKAATLQVIREGAIPKGDFQVLAEHYRNRLLEAESASTFPEVPDYAAISKLISLVYMESYKQQHKK